METRSPIEAASMYESVVRDAGYSLTGKTIMDFGYGGNYTLACELLKKGAGHIILVDYHLPPDGRRNRNLANVYPQYLEEIDGITQPKPEYISLFDGDIRRLAAEKTIAPVDFIFSLSVFEHLAEVDEITAALASLTKPEGLNLHFIDLRDHFFRYPFEMLTFSPSCWRHWLNPTTNLNRLRARDYRDAFQRVFQKTTIEVAGRDLPNFRLARARIRPEFLSGDENEDSITSLRVLAR